jgi:hypothetical protein
VRLRMVGLRFAFYPCEAGVWSPIRRNLRVPPGIGCVMTSGVNLTKLMVVKQRPLSRGAPAGKDENYT